MITSIGKIEKINQKLKEEGGHGIISSTDYHENILKYSTEITMTIVTVLQRGDVNDDVFI